MFSGKTRTWEIDVDEASLRAWKRGMSLIQDIMPHLSSDEREFIMTGITPEEWDEAFKEPEEDNFEIASVLYNGMPSASWGSREIVNGIIREGGYDNWLTRLQQLREQENVENN